MTAARFHAAAFGFGWVSDLALPYFASVETFPAGTELIEVRRASTLRPRILDFGPAGVRVLQADDGFRFQDPGGLQADVFSRGLIEVVLPESAGSALPSSFFGTVTGLLLALRGIVPIHGSAVELDGRAVLFCGTAGAGKSTAAAALIAQGARLISDDLSALILVGGAPFLLAGRSTLRLFEDVAGYLQSAVGWKAEPIAQDGKLAVQPPRVDTLDAIPLHTLALLGKSPSRIEDQLYRPNWMRVFPGREQRLAMLALAANQTNQLSLPAVEARNGAAFAVQGSFLRNALDGLRQRGH